MTTEQSPVPPAGPALEGLLVTRENGRDKNEDCGLLLELRPPPGHGQPYRLLVLADGMGGHVWGERLSREAVRRAAQQAFAGVAERLMSPPPINTVDDAIVPLSQVVADAVEAAALQVRRVVESKGIAPAGTTLVVALVDGPRVNFAHLGDSRLYHYARSTGQLVQLTEDHSVVAALVDAGMIEPEAAKHHASRNQLEFYAGAARLPEIEGRELECDPGDIILVCSDGVSAHFGELELARCFTDEAGELLPLDEVARRLLSQGVAAGVEDNQTAGLVQIPDSTGGGMEP